MCERERGLEWMYYVCVRVRVKITYITIMVRRCDDWCAHIRNWTEPFFRNLCDITTV